uniref:Palmitoyltransferase n=1 Tax=Chrysotila carterae TaxID=13221 RepID=A0A7S4BMI2_CHRCT
MCPGFGKNDSVPAHLTSMPQSQTKVWQAWHGTHSFCCDGRLMFGPDIGVTCFAAALTTGVSAVFWLFVCPWLPPVAVAADALLYVLTMLFMGLTATTDPGIVPRNAHMDDAEAAVHANASRSVEVNGVTISLKWCHTCRIWRPPRASHCSECNVCVERFDHHCPWMGQCIGRRNYRFFMGFVVCVSLLCLHTASCSLFRFLQVLQKYETHIVMLETVVQGMRRSPVVAMMLVFPLLILVCVGPLACYHCGLVCDNRTTNEEIKGTFAGRKNPFSRGWQSNCHEACCAPREASRIHPRSVACEELGTSMCNSDAAVRSESAPHAEMQPAEQV